MKCYNTELLYTAVLYKYKTKIGSCRLFSVGYCGSISKHVVTLVQYLDCVPVIPVCVCHVLAVCTLKTVKIAAKRVRVTIL